jgi:prepilin-type N-terminal cleavage/methylation domain-containing protein
MRDRSRGFTLIEILVVITIIAALMGMVVVLFGPSSKQRDITITKTRLNELSSAIDMLRSSQVLGTYPPGELTVLRDPKGVEVGRMAGTPNDTNLGIECIYVALHLTSVSVRIDEKDDWLDNTDQDTMAQNPTRSLSNALFEYVDAWHNPFVYISAREYKKWEKGVKVVMAQDSGGETVVVKPWLNEKTGLPLNQNSFQLFSAGPDGQFNTPDDIGNW